MDKSAKNHDSIFFDQALLNKSISNALSKYIESKNTKEVFDYLLSILINITESEFGFIGLVYLDENNNSYLKCKSISNIAWNLATQKLYDEHIKNGLVFDKLNSIYGHVLTTQEIYISDNPSTDPYKYGLPDGHPELKSFLGIPLMLENTIIGMAGVANRIDSYNIEMVTELDSLILACTSIVKSLKNENEKILAEKKLLVSQNKFKLLVELSSDAYWEYDYNLGIFNLSDKFLKVVQSQSHSKKINLDEFMQFIHHSDRDKILFILNSKENNDLNNYELLIRIVNHDNIIGIFKLKCSFYKTDYNNNTFLIGTLLDDTDFYIKKRQFEMLQNAANIGIWELDTKTGLLNFSEHINVIYDFDANSKHPHVDQFEKYFPSDVFANFKQFAETSHLPNDVFEVETVLKTYINKIKDVRVVANFDKDNLLGNKLVGTIQDISKQKNNDKKLKNALLKTNSFFGQSYFEHMVLELLNLLDSQYVFIGLFKRDDDELIEEQFTYVDTIAVAHNGKIIDNFSYNLLDTPCKVVLDSRICIYPSKVSEIFDKDQLLIDMGIESYIGITLNNQDLLPVGIIVSLDNKAILNQVSTQTALSVFASRAESELDRIEFNRSLAENETMFRSVAATTNDFIWDWDLKTNKISWYGNVDENLGYNSGGFVRTYEAFKKIVHPEDLPKVLESIDHHLKYNTPYALEYRLVKANGEILFWFERGIALRNNKKEAYRMVGACTDITFRKQIETELKESEKKFATLIEYAPDAIVIFDMETFKFVLGNKKALDLFKVDITQLLDLTPIDLSVEFQKDGSTSQVAALEYLNQAMNGQSITFEWIHQDVYKNPIQCQVNLVKLPIHDKNYIRGSITDISDRKKQEDAIRKLNSELESRVVNRTKELEEANKELESFSYSVSHDLRAPLRAITGFSQIVIDDYKDQLNDEILYYFEKIVNNSKKMGNLIDDLLGLSRLGRTVLSVQSCDINNTINDVIIEISNQSSNPNLKIIKQSIPMVLADKSLLKQVFINLISNAIKFSSQNPNPTIEIGYEDKEKEIVIFVKDNGVGFDMKYYNKLFGVFQRLHSPNDFDGTGVGLAIVASIIKRHKGKVWAESKINQGATFYFSLEKGENI